MIPKPSAMDRHFLDLMHSLQEDYETAIADLTARLGRQEETIAEQSREIEALKTSSQDQDQVLTELSILLER